MSKSWSEWPKLADSKSDQSKPSLSFFRAFINHRMFPTMHTDPMPADHTELANLLRETRRLLDAVPNNGASPVRFALQPVYLTHLHPPGNVRMKADIDTSVLSFYAVTRTATRITVWVWLLLVLVSDLLLPYSSKCLRKLSNSRLPNLGHLYRCTSRYTFRGCE